MKVYADNAATTQMSQAAVDAMLPYMRCYYGNPSGIYSLGQESASALYKAREVMAKRIGGDARGITFTSGGSESDNQAIISAAEIGRHENKKHIISTEFEHPAVLKSLKKLEKQGFKITLLHVPENGIINPEQVLTAITNETCLVSIMYANNEIGTIQPVRQIGEICRKKKVFFHTDAVQAAGHLHIDVQKQNIDFLSLSAHKFMGPKGVGILYSHPKIELTNIIEGGKQERGNRAGTENVPAIMGMAAAFEESCRGIDEVSAKLSSYRDRLISELLKIPGSVLNGDQVNRLSGNVNISFDGIEGETLLLLLDKEGICASSGSACESGSLEPSHVLMSIGRTTEAASSSLRLSLNELNTEKEIDYILKIVPEAVSHLRRKYSDRRMY
ncbi:MAG: cysteine desulfurase family protein [Spirochaetales bacterium]|nr:cysteine desulfurase family protein [Spirochaetales bacterium]